MLSCLVLSVDDYFVNEDKGRFPYAGSVEFGYAVFTFLGKAHVAGLYGIECELVRYYFADVLRNLRNILRSYFGEVGTIVRYFHLDIAGIENPVGGIYKIAD